MTNKTNRFLLWKLTESTLRMTFPYNLPSAGHLYVHSPLLASLSSPGVFLDTGTRSLWTWWRERGGHTDLSAKRSSLNRRSVGQSFTPHRSSWLCSSAGLPGRKWWRRTCGPGRPVGTSRQLGLAPHLANFTASQTNLLYEPITVKWFEFIQQHWQWWGPPEDLRCPPASGTHSLCTLSTASSQMWEYVPCQWLQPQTYERWETSVTWLRVI